MDASSVISLSSCKTHLFFDPCNSFSSYSSRKPLASFPQSPRANFPKALAFSSLSRPSDVRSRPRAVAVASETTAGSPSSSKGSLIKLDKSGRFCSPRAARELALLIAYAACLEGSDPVRLFDKRVNATRVPGYVFDKSSLLQYDHMSFSGEPIQVETEEEAQELMRKNERNSASGNVVYQAEVLSAPPKLVYNKFVLRLARDILGAVVGKWNEHVLVIDKIIPPNWKEEPTARILELCILHLAMAEITTIGTKHQIIINEAVDLAKRFCDGCAPRTINGCLRTFIRDHSRVSTAIQLQK
ncbi:hypothetical protein AXF42_Ash007573 [Apostasia shenzhenica]|uniref:NusB/RsmB/TIM44 domain-containing protein n=1 Tax=Apostasia shenzhenica TaxID=1088818 RepID=A0A2I0A5U5_9ASPA|nr:hypothetical protein AXF42_Ash007573 [Apostasia shenzhenica]